MLFDRLNVHRSLPNRAGSTRWSMDPALQPDRAGQRPARLPAFVARSRRLPESLLEGFETWKAMWDDARETIISGAYPDRIFEDVRWNDQAVY